MLQTDPTPTETVTDTQRDKNTEHKAIIIAPMNVQFVEELDGETDEFTETDATPLTPVFGPDNPVESAYCICDPDTEYDTVEQVKAHVRNASSKNT